MKLDRLQMNHFVFVTLLTCLLFHSLLVDSGPVRRRKNKSSTTTIDANAQPRNEVDSVLKFSAVNRPVAAGDKNNSASVNHGDPATGNNQVGVPVPGLALPDADDDNVMQVPGPPLTNNSQKVKKSQSKDGGQPQKDMDNGMAVGVGGMDHESPTTRSQSIHKGPDDNSLDGGAADRKDLMKNGSLAGSDKDMQSRGGGSNQKNGLPENPALQQPPQQPREPPMDQPRESQVDQVQAKEHHLAPSKSSQKALDISDQQAQPQVREPPVLKVDQHENLNNVLKPETKGDDDESLKPNKKETFAEHEVDNSQKQVVMKMEDLNPPDHVEGMRIEKDGHLNRDYRKEIFLGHHEEFEWSDEEKVSGRLKVMFRRADINGDDFLEAPEIKSWIMMNVKVHLNDAVQDNKKVFRHLDANKDGLVSWLEFFSHFLVAKGYVRSANSVRLNASIPLEIDDNERILKYKYRWIEADEEPRDNSLTVDEMMNFRHPEQSQMMIKRLVKEMIDNVDKDGNGAITEDEFVALPHDLEGGEPLPMEHDWQQERMNEFRNVIDINKDKTADDKELRIYFDPHNINHAKLEADNMIRMADANNDQKLSLEEVLDNADLFIGSKMIDVKRKLHDEF